MRMVRLFSAALKCVELIGPCNFSANPGQPWPKIQEIKAGLGAQPVFDDKAFSHQGNLSSYVTITCKTFCTRVVRAGVRSICLKMVKACLGVRMSEYLTTTSNTKLPGWALMTWIPKMDENTVLIFHEKWFSFYGMAWY